MLRVFRGPTDRLVWPSLNQRRSQQTQVLRTRPGYFGKILAAVEGSDHVARLCFAREEDMAQAQLLDWWNSRELVVIRLAHSRVVDAFRDLAG